MSGPDRSKPPDERVTPQQIAWACYANLYATVTQILVQGATNEQVRHAIDTAEEKSKIVPDLERRSVRESEVYVSMRRRAIEDALAGRPPSVEPFGFGAGEQPG
jgi:hypothetical protein